LCKDYNFGISLYGSSKNFSDLFLNKQKTAMNIQLIQGQFEAQEAIGIITKMIEVKIKFHEDKIQFQSNEEDIKMREKRIKQLHEELYQMRNYISETKSPIVLESVLSIHE
jgi:hypothetical protein